MKHEMRRTAVTKTNAPDSDSKEKVGDDIKHGMSEAYRNRRRNYVPDGL